MKLYYSPGACSLAPHVVLREAGLAFEAIAAPTKTHKLPDGTDFYSINPLGYVPFLVLDDGRSLRETAAILQYLADQVPEHHLAPQASSFERYELQEWLAFIGTELHKNFAPFFGSPANAEYKASVKERLLSRLAFVDEHLGKHDYLMGTQYTVADPYLFTVSGWAKHVAIDLSHLTHLAAFRERVGARPAVVEAMRAEGLIK